MIALISNSNANEWHAVIDLEVTYDNAGNPEFNWKTSSWNDELSFEIMSADLSVSGGIMTFQLPPMPVIVNKGTVVNQNSHYAQPYQAGTIGSTELICLTNNDINVGDILYYYYYNGSQFKFEQRTVIAVQNQTNFGSSPPGKMIQKLTFNGTLNRGFMYNDLLDIRTP